MALSHTALRHLTLILTAGTWSCSGMTGPSASGGPSAPDIVQCSDFSDSASSAYVLPVAVGRRFEVSKTFGHYLTSNGGVGLYAIDIDMPIGTDVHAIRSGIVAAVEERFSDSDHATFHENWVMVRHADGTVARYIHLTQNGASVEAGDNVAQGQVVGQSGNSGDSKAPHLHFDVQRCGPNLPPGYNAPPCGHTVPLSFRNTEPHACGLEARRYYTVLPFVPDPR